MGWVACSSSTHSGAQHRGPWPLAAAALGLQPVIAEAETRWRMLCALPAVESFVPGLLALSLSTSSAQLVAGCLLTTHSSCDP